KDSAHIVDQIAANDGHGLTRPQIEHLVRRYGARTPEVIALVKHDAALNQLLVPGLPDIWAEAAYAARTEMALQPDDILLRRTKIGLKDPAESTQIYNLIKEKIGTFSGSIDS